MNVLVEQAAAQNPFVILADVLRASGHVPGPDAVLSQAARNELLRLYPGAVVGPSEYRTPREVVRYWAAVSTHCLGWEYLALKGLDALTPAVSVVPRFTLLRSGSEETQRAFIALLHFGASASVALRLMAVDGFLDAAGLR